MYRVKPPRTHHPEHIDNNITSSANYYSLPNVVYINTTKNASTALLSWCGGNGVSVFNNNLESSIPKFWVLRNPLDRVVSSFFEVRKLVKANKFVTNELLGKSSFNGCLFDKKRESYNWEEDVNKLKISDETASLWLSWSSVEDSILESFNQFLDSIKNNNFYDIHTYPQIIYPTDCGFDVSQVEILLFDSLSVDLDNFCKKHNILNPKRFKIQNRTMNPQKRVVKSHVDSNLDIQNKIKEIYKEDWDLYNKIKNSRHTL
tara:strand:- start:12841 stop:13620 length:780 start_codon:yes stop_codon:yes gene_type:complete